MNLSTLNQQLFDAQGFTKLSDVQQAVISTHDNRDLVVLSETGTGKTFAYLMRLYDRMDFARHENQAIIITPTRELAMQVEQVAKLVVPFTGCTIKLAIGGQDKENYENTQIIIGTPGRIRTLIQELGSIRPTKYIPW